ncbi:MAG: hypothetical protein CVV61_09080, partial [Tenericutes bacterium HGW-Tenericutes-6]
MFGVLYLQSSYSMLKNTIPLSSLVKEGKSGGYDFIALSDENLHGMLSLYQEAHENKIKPILGLKILVQTELDETGFLVYVKDEQGYQNLLTIMRLRSEQNLNLESLILHQKGLIFVTSGADSLIDKSIIKQDYDSAKHWLLRFKKSFVDFYLGLCLDTFDMEMKVAPFIYQLSEQTNVMMLPIHQTSYLAKEDKEVYEALIKIEDEKNEVAVDANYSLLNKKELIKMFADYPYVFGSLEKVVNSISYTWKNPKFDMPIYKVEHGTPKEFLESLAKVGLKKRLTKLP